MKHLAIILDGNRRWARDHRLPSLEGHRRGYENLKTIGLAALERGVEYLSVFAFSTENWKRSQEEVGFLMELFLGALTRELDFFVEHDVRLRVVGRREGLSDKIVDAIDAAQAKTAGGKRGQINVCINYGGRAEIVDAMKKLATAGRDSDDIDETLVAASMWTVGIPEPDMIVRTGGERRLSGFLTWSGVYSELKFVDKYWPDFSVEDLEECLYDFEHRQRRFGE
ncbi:di-trans,poly-cis-decaprenylcistransferase [Candidatus Uhrbacteria bacterium]|nr:di-trans,poly-cis-decaprenylcistransferase [Candidatus Uhrbacteria bacterium]